MENFTNTLNLIVTQTQLNMHLLLTMLLILWGINFFNCLLGYRLNYLGIIPRRLFGIPGIILSPVLHGNFNHLFFNSIPLFVLSDFILIYGQQIFILATIAITIISGTLVWLFGRTAIHIGASGLITGYWSFLVVNMYHEGGALATILGLVSIYYFAGIFFGIFPSEKGASWEGHLFGLIAGVITNYGLNYYM